MVGGQEDGVKTADPSHDEKKKKGEIQKEAVPCYSVTQWRWREVMPQLEEQESSASAGGLNNHCVCPTIPQSGGTATGYPSKRATMP